MISIISSNKLFYKRQEIWFYNGDSVDLYGNNLFYKSFILPKFDVIDLKENYTSTINLKSDEDTLFRNIRIGFRNEIRRAEKEVLTYSVSLSPTTDELKEYILSYNKFAFFKKLEGRMGLERFMAYIKSSQFIITYIRNRNENITFHSYLIDKPYRVILLFSHHNINFANNNLRGYANKYHHWKDILYFKKMSCEKYDFGGTDLINTLNIARFKMCFGGFTEKQYDFQLTKGIYSFLTKLRK